MMTCDYVLYQPQVFDYHGALLGAECVHYPDAHNRSTLLAETSHCSSCNTAFTFWLGADALYDDGDNE